MTFTKWLETFVSEKNLDTEQVFTVTGKSGPNYIPLGCVLDAIKSAALARASRHQKHDRQNRFPQRRRLPLLQASGAGDRAVRLNA